MSDTDPGPPDAKVTLEMIAAGIALRSRIRQSADVVAFPLAQPKDAGGQDVERINYYPLYELGGAIRSLEDHTTDKDVDARALFFALSGARTALNSLLRGRPFSVGISKASIHELLDAIVQADVQYFTEDDNKTAKYPKDGQRIFLFGIQPAIRKFEILLMNEAATYAVPPRGIYSTAALIDFADQSFPPDVLGHVPEQARTDWKAAGRCLAFNLLSATGFHVARAVESTLEVYYQTFTGKLGKLRSWNDYIRSLNGVLGSGASPAPTEKTLAELMQMKDDYRNPLVHPRVTLTEIDARMLFDNGESVIIAMAAEIKIAREAGGVQPSLAVVGGSADLDSEIPF